jgi:pimeloyl-ACP methyl ester carboxylesterase
MSTTTNDTSTVSSTASSTGESFSGFVRAGDVELWVEQRGSGPDVVLLAGLTDPAEAWTFQLEGLSDRYRLTAFDNRSAGRSPQMPDGFTVADMADDVAALMRALGISSAHIMGFSGGSANAQELALRHPELVRSLVLMSTWARADAYMQTMLKSWKWLPFVAPSEREMLEAFFLFIYTARAHEEGLVDVIIEEALAFPHPQSPEDFVRQLSAWAPHDTFDRLPAIAVPTLVLAGGEDVVTPARLGRVVAERIPGAELRVLPGEAHQPFQERPDEYNALVHDFWSRIASAPVTLKR